MSEGGREGGREGGKEGRRDGGRERIKKASDKRHWITTRDLTQRAASI